MAIGGHDPVSGSPDNQRRDPWAGWPQLSPWRFRVEKPSCRRALPIMAVPVGLAVCLVCPPATSDTLLMYLPLGWSDLLL